MASDRKFTAYRPDDEETVLLAKLAKKRGLSASRLIGTAIREMAQRDDVTATAEEITEAKEARTKKDG
jgi:hypothetical protein